MYQAHDLISRTRFLPRTFVQTRAHADEDVQIAFRDRFQLSTRVSVGVFGHDWMSHELEADARGGLDGHTY